MDSQGYSLVTSINNGSRSPVEQERAPPEPPAAPVDNMENQDTVGSVQLRRSFWILIIASLYAVLVLSSWILTCILSVRPLTTASYSFDDYFIPAFSEDTPHDSIDSSAFVTNEKWYRAARVMQTIGTVLTIPITSAVCSNAAVVFIQRCGKSSKMTLRMLLALADKGWTNTDLYIQLFKGPVSCWNRYFTSFLLVAIALHVLGALIAPLQSLLLSPKTIKVPNSPKAISVAHLFQGQTADSTGITLSMLSSAALTALRSANGNSYNEQIWAANSPRTETHEGECGTTTQLVRYSQLDDPFIAVLPNDFNTGLVRQRTQRLNSSTHATFLSQEEPFINCKAGRSFQKQYNGIGWAVAVCAPVLWDDNRWQSPWNRRQLRQDISEELYLHFNFSNPNESDKLLKSPRHSTLLKITANTTAGWFELPNYRNANKPGPLEGKYLSSPVKNLADVKYYQTDDSLEKLVAPGPLLAMTYAIFGARDSFMSICATALNSDVLSSDASLQDVQFCSNAPLLAFLDSKSGQICIGSDQSPRAYHDIFGDYNAMNTPYDRNWEALTYWLVSMGSFQTDTKRISDAFETGLALVNTAWAEVAGSIPVGSIDDYGVMFDLGGDTLVPKISQASIIAISILHSVYLISLLCVASYAAFYPKWTGSMNGFAMMRIGAAVADRMPLLITYKEDEIHALDKIPGWIGGTSLNGSCEEHDSGKNSDQVAKLELGSPCRLRGKQKYACYEADQITEKKESRRER
ncbi:hypothetical protein BDV36DRAFT_296809 [Aspergillus pseudocaelatus]|uniref:Uncharacterized protein n=1 Tax=Aspergillus pseudocaelatus TaxID=1825620 RepID=A0ABQ6WI81_9EURO|nr:hypothetical protein BDV36DRAFT_296809 [Aspergillus pseudocaelatus]